MSPDALADTVPLTANLSFDPGSSTMPVFILPLPLLVPHEVAGPFDTGVPALMTEHVHVGDTIWVGSVSKNDANATRVELEGSDTSMA